MRPKRPRLNPAVYVGFQRCFLTFCTDDRQRFFVKAAVVDAVLEQILPTAIASRVAVVAYCFMPDHLHLLVETESESADLLTFVHQAKQRSGFTFSERWKTRLWQPSFHDHLLRDDEATISVARYVVENPVRAKIVESPHDYPFLGSARYTMEEMLDAVCWQR